MYSRVEIELGFVTGQIRSCCGPLFFTRSLESAAQSVTANASFGLVDTGIKRLLVTCHHVWQTLQEERRTFPGLKMCACLDKGPPVVVHPEQLIDADTNLDLATFDMASLLPGCAGRTFFPLSSKEESDVRRGDRIAFIGYPGRFRSSDRTGIQFGFSMYAVNVSDFNALRLVVNLSRAKEVRYREPEQPDQESPHGGISGSPCFLVRSDQPLQLVAFATEEAMQILRFTRARCLNPDGTLSRHA